MSDPPDDQLLEAIKEQLEKDGQLNKLKSELRASVISVLKRVYNDSIPAPEVPEETRLLNELIKEYLIWNGYRHTEDILVTECGQSENVSRESLSDELSVVTDNRTQKLPLLYYILEEFKKKNSKTRP